MEPGREVVKFRTRMWEGMGPKHSTFSLTPLEILCHLIMIWLVHTRQSQCRLELRLVNSPTETFLNSINDLNERNTWTVVLRRLLRVPWTARRSNQVHPKGKSVLNVHWKDWCWSWNSSTLATWCEKRTHWKRPWCWERLKAGGEGDDRGWDGWMALPTWWTWVWVKSRSWWWTGKPGMLQSTGLQRVRHDWATELNWTSETWVWCA